MICDHKKNITTCPECEIDFLDACIARDMKRIEVLKAQIEQEQKSKGETNGVICKR